MTVSDELLNLNKEMLRVLKTGDKPKAASLALRAVQMAESLYGPDGKTLGYCLNNLGEVYERQGRYSEAKTLFKRSLLILAPVMSLQHPDVERVRDNFLGEFDDDDDLDAEQLINDLSHLSLLNMSAEGNYHAGDFAAGMMQAEEALALAERVYGPDAAAVANCVNVLALMYQAQRRDTEAEELFKNALAIRERRLSSHDPVIANTLVNLGILYHRQKRYADAEPLYRRTVTILEQASDNQIDLATALNDLARLLQDQERYGEAEPIYARIISIYEKSHKASDPAITGPLFMMAVLCEKQRRYEEAERHAQRVLSIHDSLRKSDHPNVATCLLFLADLYEPRGRLGEATALRERALEIYEKLHGPYDPNLAPILNNLASVYRDQSRYEEAEQLYTRAFAIYEKEYGPDYPDVGKCLDNLWMLYLLQDRMADAQEISIRRGRVPGSDVVNIPILFATNRILERRSSGITFGSSQTSNPAEIGFGKVIVRAPKPEVLNRAVRLVQGFGQLHRAAGRQTTADRLTLLDLKSDEGDASFVAAARDRLYRAVRFPNQAFVFVHGYNNSFEDAVRRTAMIAFDLDFDGPTYLFTWPSHGKWTGYGTDRKRARVAAPFLVALLARIGAGLPDTKVHLLAHSTGAEIVLSALAELAAKGSEISRPIFGELILAHADVAPKRLELVAPSIRTLGLGITSYSSNVDWALRISGYLRFNRPRVGSRPVSIPGVDAIDITGLSVGSLALEHTRYVDSPIVFGDMARLMARGERPPHKRTPVFRHISTARAGYWQYLPAAANQQEDRPRIAPAHNIQPELHRAAVVPPPVPSSRDKRDQPTVVIYTTPEDRWSKRAKEFLVSHRITFTEHNVVTDIAKRQEMIATSGQMGVPVILVDKELIVGFDEEHLRKLLNI